MKAATQQVRKRTQSSCACQTTGALRYSLFGKEKKNYTFSYMSYRCNIEGYRSLIREINQAFNNQPRFEEALHFYGTFKLCLNVFVCLFIHDLHTGSE